MIDTITLEFGTVKIYKNFVIVTMKEGITVKPEYNVNLENWAKKYYKDQKFGYISNRKNSYAVNPMIYLKTSEVENLVAFAVVSPDGLKATNLEVEKIFLKKPLKHFTDLKEAKIWILEMIESSSS